MTNFEKITASPKMLGKFLAAMPIAEGPWDAEFQKQFCANCQHNSCDACPNEKERNNPTWWLKQTVVGEEEWMKQITSTASKIFVREWKGNLEYLDYAAAVMLHLGNWLSASDEKIRVTIERDPEIERFTWSVAKG